MDIKKLQKIVIDALEDVKAQEILLFDTTHLTALFDSMAIASGTSNRQTKALAASVRDKVKQAGGEVVSIEGEDTGEWVLVDLGDMIVHIMQPAIRAYYRLEEIWGDKPVKLAEAKRRTRTKASNDTDDDKPVRRRHIVGSTGEAAAEAATPKRASKTAAKTAGSASKTGTRTAAKSGAKSAATAAGKTATKAASKTASASPAADAPDTAKAPRRSAAKSTTPRKTAAAKTPVGKTVKVAAGKTASAGKPPTRRVAGR